MKSFHSKLCVFDLAGAVNAQWNGGVEVQTFRGNGFATSKAPSECSSLHSSERGFDALQMHMSPVLGGLSHCLPLEGVHPGDSSHGGLIQLDGLCSFFPGMFTLHKIIAEVKQELLEMFEVEVGRSHDICGGRLRLSGVMAVNNITGMIGKVG